ncbi:membrane protein [Streptomyces phage TurkishDelight]|uniref:Membrane protein n=1 Tax=Streptomyces phage TurkishDelight TaxID=2793708 RepID=A0A7T0Q4F1_9CAUD|nr:membrane protein [Streptomyces phage TurkishDelight]QPL14047.1 membrane protein [Streptomyces phage TurkishDelight]
MAAAMRKRVEPIPGTPLPHGILNTCTTVLDVDVEDIHELMGVEWMALGCCPVRQWEDPCLTEESPGEESPGEAPQKEFCRPQFEHATPITLYAGSECSTLGWTHEEAVAHARATMDLGEQHGLEAAFWNSRLTTDVVDLTPPDGPLTVAQGVALLEGCLAEAYGGVGVLHVPAGAAALLGCCNLLHEDPATGSLRTLAGNCAVIGAGYSAMNTGPGGIPAEPGTTWLYITGPVHIRRGPLDVIPNRSASVNIRTNDRRILLERTYVVGTTCTVCAVQVVVYP